MMIEQGYICKLKDRRVIKLERNKESSQRVWSVKMSGRQLVREEKWTWERRS